MRGITFLLVCLSLAISTTGVFAGPWESGMGRGGSSSMPADAALDLTSEQSQRLQSLRQSFLEEMTPLQNRLFTKRAELRLLWSAPKPDHEQIASKQKEISELEQAIDELSTRHRLDCREVLTPEQKEKASGMDGGMHRGWGSRSGRMLRGWKGRN